MFEDWIKEKQTATDHDIEKDFQIPNNTLKKWRLNDKGPIHFRLGTKFYIQDKLLLIGLKNILRTKKLMSFHSDLSVPKRIFRKLKLSDLYNIILQITSEVYMCLNVIK